MKSLVLCSSLSQSDQKLELSDLTNSLIANSTYMDDKNDKQVVLIDVACDLWPSSRGPM